jgi:hypothetical protein
MLNGDTRWRADASKLNLCRFVNGADDIGVQAGVD